MPSSSRRSTARGSHERGSVQPSAARIPSPLGGHGRRSSSSATQQLTLNWVLLGDSVDQSFDVQVRVSANVGDLKKEIVKSGILPHGVFFNRLTLHLIPNRMNVTTNEELFQAVKIVTRDEKNTLKNLDKISSVFVHLPEEGRIHLLVDYVRRKF